MKQSDLLSLVSLKLKEITGNDYVVDYAPHRNISEQSTSTYRCVTPGSMRLETINRGYKPVTHQNVTVGIFKVLESTNQNTQIETLQDELTNILQSFMSVRNPIIFQKTGENDRATVEFGECNPVQDSGIVLAGLEDDPAVVVGTVTLGFRVC